VPHAVFIAGWDGVRLRAPALPVASASPRESLESRLHRNPNNADPESVISKVPLVSAAGWAKISAEMTAAFYHNVARDREIREALTRQRQTAPGASAADRKQIIDEIAAKFAAKAKLERETGRAELAANTDISPSNRDDR
jgi:hypothetical protein